MRKIILLNTGKKGEDAFVAGLKTPAAVEEYSTKKLMLHLTPSSVSFIASNKTVIFDDAEYVFLRLRSKDKHFCGLVHTFLKEKDVDSNDPINGSFAHSDGKISQMLYLALNDIPFPESFIFREESFVENQEYLRTHIKFPAVFKLDGRRGEQVTYLRDFEELEHAITQKQKNVLALVQPFIENTFDTRTLVYRDTIFGSIARTRQSGYLNNIAKGAIASLYTLSPEEENVARRAAHACKIDFAGVDIIHTPSGPLVLEVNKSPQIKGFESVHDFKVLSKLAACIEAEHS